MSNSIAFIVKSDNETIKRGFYGELSIETVERFLKNNNIGIAVNENGSLTFRDSKSNLVDVFIRIRPFETSNGKELLKNKIKEQDLELKNKREELKEILENMPLNEALEKLKK